MKGIGEILSADIRPFWKWILIAIPIEIVGFVLIKCEDGLWLVQAAGLLVILVFLAILLRSAYRIVLQKEGFKGELPMLLGTLGIGIVVLWISQGVLATQVNIQLKGEAKQMYDDPNRMLVVVAFALENTGVRQTQVKDLTLLVCAAAPRDRGENCNNWTKVFEKAKRGDADVGMRNKEELGFGKPSLKEFQHSDPEYILTWGTQETRQAAFEIRKAEYYDLQLSLGTGEIGTDKVNKWRAAAIIPLEEELIKNNMYPSGLTGKSLEQGRPSEGSRSTFELLKKFIGMGKD